jgi:hypothetical protein
MIATARAEVAPPPELRVTWEFECHASDKGTARFVITGKAIEDGTMVIAWEKHGKSSTKYIPLSTWPLGFFSREEAPDHTSHRIIDWGSLAFKKLAVGEKVKAWVRQFDTRWGRNRWKWKAEIKDKTAVETQGFGTLEVYVIVESIYSPEWSYGATIVNHYSPKMNMITYWKEHDSNERVEECRLVSRK